MGREAIAQGETVNLAKRRIAASLNRCKGSAQRGRGGNAVNSPLRIKAEIDQAAGRIVRLGMLFCPPYSGGCAVFRATIAESIVH
jgi:hypothetical protein